MRKLWVKSQTWPLDLFSLPWSPLLQCKQGWLSWGLWCLCGCSRQVDTRVKEESSLTTMPNHSLVGASHGQGCHGQHRTRVGLLKLILNSQRCSSISASSFSLFSFLDSNRVSPSLCACMLSHFSCVWLFCNLLDYSPPGSSDHGILQAGILEWLAMPSCRGSSWPSDWTHISYLCCIGRQVFYH